MMTLNSFLFEFDLFHNATLSVFNLYYEHIVEVILKTTYICILTRCTTPLSTYQFHKSPNICQLIHYNCYIQSTLYILCNYNKDNNVFPSSTA